MRHSKIRSLAHEQKLYSRAAELSRILRIPFVEPVVRVIHISADGNETLCVDRHSRSFIRNYYVKHSFMIASPYDITGTYADGDLRGKNSAGTLINTDQLSPNTGSNVTASNDHLNGSATRDDRSVTIGTGLTAESFDDYGLDTQIDDGSGAGEMDYGASAFNDDWDAGNNRWYANIERLFSNNSGGSITVNESGLIYRTIAQSSYLMRDVFGSGVAVANGESISVFYEFRFSYP